MDSQRGPYGLPEPMDMRTARRSMRRRKKNGNHIIVKLGVKGINTGLVFGKL